MGTTQQTQQSSQFDPTAMATYKGLQGPLGSMTTGYMQDPFGNPFFRTQQLMGNRQAMQLGQTGTSNLLRNMTTSNMFGGASSPAGLEMLQNQNRANTGLTANLGFLQPVQNALGMQQWAGNIASNYRPLQTGQHQTQSTGGLGTWLPQVAGLGLGLATGGLGGLFAGGLGSMIKAGGGPGGGMANVLGNNPEWLGGQGGMGTGFNPATFMQNGVPAPPPSIGSWGPPQSGGGGSYFNPNS